MSFMARRPYAGWEDPELAAALSRGDALAFAEIYERYWWRVYEQASRKVSSKEVAEELVQDVFEALWERPAAGPILQLQAYLLSAVKYRIIDFYKTQRVREGYATYQRLHAATEAAPADEPLALQDLADALAASLHQLPEKTREVFRLRRFEKYTVAEIAEHLQLSTKAVEYHLTKSCRILRLSLREFVVSLALVLGWWGGN